MPLENLQQTVGQDTTTTLIFRSTPINPNTTTVNTSTGTIQHPGHIPFWRNDYNIRNKTTTIHPTTDTHPPFLGDALSWLTGTATTKDIHSIKTRINQLITTQASQHNTLVHIMSILNITRYATQVNRHSINTLMDAMRTTSHEINNLYNLTTSLATSINFHQMILHIRSVFANLHDSLNYI